MNTGVSYSMFYEILLNLREYFHSYGRIDDSNAKLDEIIKLIAINFSMAKRGEKFGLSYIRNISKNLTGNEKNIARALIYIFESEAQNEFFINDDGTNIFGSNITLNMQPTEDEFAEKIISEIEKIDFINLLSEKKYSDFDLINECFGHFVRENFRNNKEDAQYMTPYEVSKSMLDIIFHDMEQEGFLNQNRLENFTIMDPTCGVGTLLIESSNHFTKYIECIRKDDKKESIISNFRRKGMIGQDKVDRMVRLSKINALLLGCNISNVKIGNSIVGESFINNYSGKIDLIFTNPPFGAEYNIKELTLKHYPILSKLNLTINTISSELLMLDKCIGLLSKGGYLAIILPDSVFSSKGINSIYRDEILKQITLKGILELPSVTFAQAGTRTNTCILYLKNSYPIDKSKFFMAECKNIGYIVKERMGVPIKISNGTNEMTDIARILANDNVKNKIISHIPSITKISKTDLISNILKPSFYAASKFHVVDSLMDSVISGFEIKKLADVVDFVTMTRKSYLVSDNIKHISVLHINSDCTINFDEVVKFNPTSKGRTCECGDLIFSKINPRIPRMAVIPAKKYKLICSNEFEIMRPKTNIGIYILCFLLRTENVKVQIESMTSGTSSSHSRIKREQLEEILIPVPTIPETIQKFEKINEKLKESIKKIYESDESISDCMNGLNSVYT